MSVISSLKTSASWTVEVQTQFVPAVGAPETQLQSPGSSELFRTAEPPVHSPDGCAEDPHRWIGGVLCGSKVREACPGGLVLHALRSLRPTGHMPGLGPIPPASWLTGRRDVTCGRDRPAT